MRKSLRLLSCSVLMMAFSLQTFASGPVSESGLKLSEKKEKEYLAAKEALSKLTYEEAAKLTPKQFRELTGKKLNLVQKIAFKAAKKQIKKAGDGGGDKKWITALLLVIFLGGLGIHRFYLGYTWQGVVQLLTLGGLGIWSTIDMIRIITRNLKPKNGDYVD
jgi:TM2 domain